MEISPSNIHFNRPGLPRQKRPWISSLIWLAIAFIAIWCLTQGLNWTATIELHAQTAERLPYGSRAGMEITVSDRIGIGTSGATIVGRLTSADAEAYCKQYVRDQSTACIDRYLAETHLSKSIGADCDAGIFDNFYGEKFRVEKVKGGASGGGGISRL